MNQRYATIDSALFISNRKRFVSEMKSKSIAIFHSNDEMPRNGDCCYPFRQNSDFFYLTGIDQEQSVLMLFPHSPDPKFKEVLFVRETDEHTKVWEGEKYSKEEARKVSGIQTVYWTKEYETLLTFLAEECTFVYLNNNENDRAKNEVISRDARLAPQTKKLFQGKRFERSAPIMVGLREIKSKVEIELIKEACAITEKAFRRTLSFIKPGVWEYEIEAEISHEFTVNRSNGHAYSPIIASGKNACVLHYVNNNQLCKKGDLILMDFGAEYANYASDLTRTVPVSGKFSKRQKQVYNAVLNVLKESRKLLVAGNTFQDYNKDVRTIIEKELVDIGLITTTEIRKQDPQNPVFRKYFMHGISHFMGLDVHDLGDRSNNFQSGMIFTCEPGIYIPEENIGIRLENDILITAKGPQDLMKNIPIEAEEIEELMK
ncbi:MAG: aminopeptidase P N-terminal domain-containing protein [Bacteroidetes bacterium]|nr:aminopeptidase P N-terminal domain-containing protein [Bacteroidota bacterium]